MSIAIFLPRHAEKVTVSVGDKQLRYHSNFCFSVSLNQEVQSNFPPFLSSLLPILQM